MSSFLKDIFVAHGILDWWFVFSFKDFFLIDFWHALFLVRSWLSVVFLSSELNVSLSFRYFLNFLSLIEPWCSFLYIHSTLVYKAFLISMLFLTNMGNFCPWFVQMLFLPHSFISVFGTPVMCISDHLLFCIWLRLRSGK